MLNVIAGLMGPVSQTPTGPPLANTRRMTMAIKIRCPHCNSDDYETYATTGGDGAEFAELCECYDCGKQFRVIYKPNRIVKEDEKLPN